MRRWKPMASDSRCHIELVLKANHVQVTNEQHSCGLLTQETVSDSSSQLSCLCEAVSCKKPLRHYAMYEAFCRASDLLECRSKKPFAT